MVRLVPVGLALCVAGTCRASPAGMRSRVADRIRCLPYNLIGEIDDNQVYFHVNTRCGMTQLGGSMLGQIPWRSHSSSRYDSTQSGVRTYLKANWLHSCQAP